MTPQILQMLSGAITPHSQQAAQPQLAQIRQMISAMKSAGNPQALLQQMLQQRSPQLAQAMDLVQKHGGDARAAFRELAGQKGLSPEEIDEIAKMLG